MIDKTVDYSKFLKNKARIVHQSGMDIDESELHPSAFPHQRDAIRWALRVGRSLIAMSFGLGKTHVQVEIARLVVEKHGGPRAWSRLMQMSPRGFIVSLWNVPDYRMIAGGRA